MKKEFKIRFLSGTLKCFAGLPLPILYLFSDFIFLIVFYIVKYRRRVVRKNLEESFPEKSPKELKEIEKEYYRFLGDVIVETLKLMHISDAEMKKRVKVVNPEAVNQSLAEGRNVVLLMGHYGNWEWVQEISRYFLPEAFMGSIYHPLNNPVWDEIFHRIRSRWGAHIVSQRHAVKTLLDKSHFPWVFGFIADARPLSKDQASSLNFLNHKTWFIYGPEVIGKKTGADFFYLEMKRPRRGRYEIVFHPLKAESADNEPYPISRLFWEYFEKTIRENPALWLWSHKRWKE